MDQLETLESQSIFILREAYRSFKELVMLWSIGKDSTVLLWLARKAFFGHAPIPLMHIDTSYKIPAMIEYRNRFALEWKLQEMGIEVPKEALDSLLTEVKTRAESQKKELSDDQIKDLAEKHI